MNTSNIYFHTEDTDFKLQNESTYINWISSSIADENKLVGELNFIFCSDAHLLPINQKYLNHNTLTDIITFNYVENNVISGDIFISIDRVIENAQTAKVKFIEELSRVMIHGVLHLIGYNDKSVGEAQEIRAKEDFYLNLHSQF